MSRAAVEMFTRSTYVIRYIAHSRPRTTELAAGVFRRIVKAAIDYINELPGTGRHRRVRLRAVPRHDDVRRPRTDVGSDRRHRPAERRRARQPRARCRHQFRRHGERLLGRRVRDDARQGARQPAARGRARDEGARAHGPGSEPGGPVAAPHSAGGRGQPEAARHRLHRPVSDSPLRSADEHRGHAPRARRPRARRQGALHRLLQPRRRGS